MIALQRCSGVFDVVDVVDAVASVTHLPNGEGFRFLAKGEVSPLELLMIGQSLIEPLEAKGAERDALFVRSRDRWSS